MKRMIAVLWLVLLLLSGCGGKTGSAEEVPPPEEERPLEENTFPGSWTAPEGWVIAEQYTTPDKIFYVEGGHEEDEAPDNISIEVGTNRYGAEEHEKFRDAIVQQLVMQLNGIDAELTGDGTFTAREDILYIFTISEENMVTKQFYIVGDRRYCLIQLTNFTGSESVDDAARAMADSFVWNE